MRPRSQGGSGEANVPSCVSSIKGSYRILEGAGGAHPIPFPSLRRVQGPRGQEGLLTGWSVDALLPHRGMSFLCPQLTHRWQRGGLSLPPPPTAGWGSLQGTVFTPKATHAGSLAIVTACYTE